MSTELPNEYAMTITQSFAAGCGITALLLVLEGKDVKTQRAVKEQVINIWKRQWVDIFQRDLARRNEILCKVEGGDVLQQPEELQVAFNAYMAMAEKSARVSLRLEEAS